MEYVEAIDFNLQLRVIESNDLPEPFNILVVFCLRA